MCEVGYGEIMKRGVIERERVEFCRKGNRLGGWGIF